MTTTTERLPSGVFKTTDEDGNVTFSQTPPNTSTPPQPSSTPEGGFNSNGTRGVVRTIPSAADRKKTEELMEKLRAEGEARAKAKAEAEAREANENKWGGVGVNAGAKLVLPNGKVVFDIKKEAGHIPTDTSLSKDIEVGDKIKAAAGKEDVPTPGLSIGVGASISARRQEKLGMSEGQRAAVLKAKEIKEEADKIKENAKKNIAKRMPPEAVNEQTTREIAELIKKYGKEAANAALE